MMLRHVFETHQPSNPAEELVKSAASGDVVRTEEILAGGMCSVDESFTGHTALQAACQNGHIEVVRCLIRYHANIEEEVQQRRGRAQGGDFISPSPPPPPPP